MRSFPLIAIISVAMTTGACSDSFQENDITDGAFRFDPRTGNAGDITTTLDIPSFRITAYSRHNDTSDWKVIMDNVVVTRTAINSWTYSPAVDWPEGEVIDFYAVSPATYNIKNNPWWYTIIPFYESNASEDFLIATRLATSQSDHRIKINFRHALARVAFTLRASTPGVRARVRKMRLCNIADGGDFYFPTFTTSPDMSRGDIKDCWHIYNLTATSMQVFEGTDNSYIVITDTPDRVGQDNYFIIPCTLPAYTPPAHWDGTHIELEYQLVDEAGTVLWPADKKWDVKEIGLAYATPGGEWLPGCSYVYSIDLCPPDSSSGAKTYRPSMAIHPSISCKRDFIPEESVSITKVPCDKQKKTVITCR